MNQRNYRILKLLHRHLQVHFIVYSMYYFFVLVEDRIYPPYVEQEDDDVFEGVTIFFYSI